MTARICQTCKHYEPSAVWRRGWCRNPRLYAPQQSQLVEQDSLDCSRGLGSAWEAADPSEGQRPVGPHEKQSWQPLRLFVPQRLVPAGAGVMASTGLGGGGGSGSGSGGTGGPGGSFAGPPRPERPVPPSGTERTVSYQPEERYWTDYLRIALPVAGLLILLGVGWWWAGQIIGGGDDDGGSGTEVALGEIATSIGASPPPVTPTATAATLAPTTGAAPSATATTPREQPAEVENTPATVVERVESVAPVATSADAADAGNTRNYSVNAIVRTVEDQVNLRDQPSRDGAILAPLREGTELRITGPFEEGGEEGDWWPVEVVATGQSGFVFEDLIDAAD